MSDELNFENYPNLIDTDVYLKSLKVVKAYVDDKFVSEIQASSMSEDDLTKLLEEFDAEDSNT